MKLSDTQTIILSAAANRDDGLAIVPPKLPAAARNAVAKSLQKNGLLEEVRSVHFAHGWREAEDGTHTGLRITPAGLAALNIDESEWPAHAKPAAEPTGQDANTAPPAASAETVAQEAAAVADALDAAPLAPTPRASLRDAAALVLAAWDDEANRETDIIAALEGPMETLRALLAAKAPRDTAAPRKAREGTKQEAVLTMLRRAEGATVAQIAEATGWATHTVRGFLAGLKKKGFTIATLERVRMVGPNKEGAKGSYTIYRAE